MLNDGSFLISSSPIVSFLKFVVALIYKDTIHFKWSGIFEHSFFLCYDLGNPCYEVQVGLIKMTLSSFTLYFKALCQIKTILSLVFFKGRQPIWLGMKLEYDEYLGYYCCRDEVSPSQILIRICNSDT